MGKLKTTMSEQSTFPTTLPDLVNFFLVAIAGATTFFLSFLVLAILTVGFFYIPEIDREVTEKGLGHLAAGIVWVCHLFLIILFGIPREADDTVPIAPSFIWAIAWSSVIMCAILIGAMTSILIGLRAFKYLSVVMKEDAREKAT